MDLEKLAESFSSDVINEAISEIIAEEEDLKNGDENKWYRQRQDITPPPGECSDTNEDISQTELTSASPISQSEGILDMQKVSPIIDYEHRTKSAKSGRRYSVELNNEEPLPTSQILKDVPGYISPNTRSQLLGRVGVLSSNRLDDFIRSQSEETMHTIAFDDRQDTFDEEDVIRKNSCSTTDDRSVKSTFSSNKSTYSSERQQSEGTSSIGSTTVFNSIAPEAFHHKRHLSPLIDMSERSLELEKSLAEERRKHQYLSVSDVSSKSSPRFGISSHNSSRYQASPREQLSRLSSATEYNSLPQALCESKLSPNISAQLMLSPDLAQRVSDILNQSPADVPRLTFEETLNSRENSSSSSPSHSENDKLRGSTDSSPRLPQDDLDKHVSDVLSRSENFLKSVEKVTQVQTLEEEDHSYLDKYLSPCHTSPPNVVSQKYTSYDSHSRISPRTDIQWSGSPRSPTSRDRGEYTPRSQESGSEVSAVGLNKKYMDKSSREVLEQAAMEYYSDLKRSSLGDHSPDDTLSQSRMNSTGNANTELMNLVDHSHSPGEPNTSRNAIYNDRSCPVIRQEASRPAKVITAPVSEAETQILVSKRLDRIEFMVLSALNEVPPQNRISYVDTNNPSLDGGMKDYPQDTAMENSGYDDSLRDAIKTTAPRSPIGKLPDYSLEKYFPPSKRDGEESFNMGISPVKRDPFNTFNRAQDLLAERLAQRSKERTPGRKLSSTSLTASRISPSRSPVRDLARPYPYPETRHEARGTSREHNPTSMSGADSVTTTIESTHADSDDAQPPQLPKEVLGSRKDPVKNLRGIYGTKTPKASTKSPLSERNNAISTDQKDAAVEDSVRSKHSIVGRAERALIRGNEIREKMLARHQERKSKSTQDVQPVLDLLNSPNKSISPRTSLRTERHSNDRVLEQTCLKDRTSGKMRDYHSVGEGHSVPLDFYKSPTLTKQGDCLREPVRRLKTGVHDYQGSREQCKPSEVTKAWADEQDVDDLRTTDQHRKPEQAAELRRSSLEGTSELKHRALQTGGGESPHGVSPLFVVGKRSPERAIERLPLGSEPSSSIEMPAGSFANDSTLRTSPQQHSPLSSRNKSLCSHDYNLVRPLERIDYPDNQEFRSRLTHAVNDRLMTYHILREELMQTEDEVKGRELDLAWQRISKRKSKPPSDFNDTSTTASSTASSEVFDEERMKKLRNLLNNPLGHLISKAKQTNTRTRTSKSSKPVSAQKNNSSTSNTKYGKLMEKIQLQRNEECALTETMSSTNMTTSSDNTMCSRCEQKRYAKRTSKAPTYNTKIISKSQRETSDKMVNEESMQSSTRSVTPTGLPVPFIEPQSQSNEFSVKDNQVPTPRAGKKILKDVAVMCPSPSTHAVETKHLPAPNIDRKQKPRPVTKEPKSPHINDEVTSGVKRNAFQKSREVDHQQEGLMWFVPHTNPRPWTKTSRERKALSVASEVWMPGSKSVVTSSEKKTMNELSQVFNEVTSTTSYVPTLQEALRARNQRFVSGSRERQRQIKLRSDERQINKVHDEQRAQLFNIQPYNYQHLKPDKYKPLPASKKAIPKEEMYYRTNRVYKVLPEVTSKIKMGLLQQERIAYRLKAKLFNKKVQRHVLDQARVIQLVGSNKQSHKRA